jgi:hypothetical protein
MGSPADRFTRLQKVAVFLIALGEDRVRPLLTGLGAATLEQLNAAIVGLGDVTPRERAAAMLEVEAYLRHGTPLRLGPGETDPPPPSPTAAGPDRRRRASPPPRPAREPAPGHDPEPEAEGQPWAPAPRLGTASAPPPTRPRGADAPVRSERNQEPGQDQAPAAPRRAGSTAGRGLRPLHPASGRGAPPKGREPAARGPQPAGPSDGHAGDEAADEALRRLRRRLDEGGIDWGRAGFDFGEGFAGPPRDRP